MYYHNNLVKCTVVSTKENKGKNITRRQYSYVAAVSIADAELNEDGNDKSCQHATFSYKFNVNGLYVGKTAVNELLQKAHGNSKQRRELYNKTYSSTIKQIRKKVNIFRQKM